MSTLAKIKSTMAAKNLRAVAERQTHTLAVGALGFGLGMYESGKDDAGKPRALPAIIKGVDPKLQWGVGLALLADRTSGTMRTASRAGADLLIGIGTYQMGRASKFISGDSVRGIDPGDEVIDV